MLPFCLDQGVGVLPWSPLARGKLTRDWDDKTARTETDKFGQTLYQQHEVGDRQIAEVVKDVAEARGVSRAQVALAWVRQQQAVTSPIFGATKPQHLADAVASVELTLTDDELDRLAVPYITRAAEGF